MSSKASSIRIRGIMSVEKDEESRHWASACQVVAHVCIPLRKALIHFYLTCRDKNDTLPDTWDFLVQLGKLFQALVVSAPKDSAAAPLPPINPTDLYKALKVVAPAQHRNPKTASLAVRYLFQLIQSCTQTLPSSYHSNMWRNLLDLSGMGLVAKCTTVGKQLHDNEIIQRTQRDTRIQWCPLPMQGKMESVNAGLDSNLLKQVVQDWDSTKYDFEVKLPIGWGASKTAASKSDDDDDDSKKEDDDNNDDEEEKPWEATRKLQFQTLPDHLFLGLQRFVNEPINGADVTNSDDDDAVLLNETIQVPQHVDMSKYTTPEYKKESTGNLTYNLVGGILMDDDNFVAILKNAGTKTGDNDDDDDDDEPTDWNLLESEEIIPMTSSDVSEFLQGDGEGICGTVLVYTRAKPDPQTHQLLSDIIISHVSGHMSQQGGDYYDEEIIEEIIED